MGICASGAVEQDADTLAGSNVDLELLQQNIQELFKFKILLLGAGESGKSTIVKQLKLVHKKKLGPDDLKLVAISLHQNVVDCMKALFRAVKEFNEVPLTEDELALEQALMEHDESQRLTGPTGTAILACFNGDAMQAAYKRRNEFWLLDSLKYYITNLTRFCEPDFVPSEEDAVMARIRTTGIVVTDLEQRLPKTDDQSDEPDSLMFKVVDVGGQRNERKKWMHCFDDVKAILFICNLAGYNQVLFEDSKKNRMHESMDLFQKVVGNTLFTNTPIFLFLNKKDLFESMIKETDLSCAFPEYKGGKDLAAALGFIQEEFRKRLPTEKQDVKTMMEPVSAAVKRDIKCAFEEVKKALYENNKQALFGEVRRLKKEHQDVQRAKAGGGSCCNKQPNHSAHV